MRRMLCYCLPVCIGEVLPLKVREALNVFGGPGEVAKVLKGVRHRSAVYQWDPEGLVPLGAAFTLARAAPPGTLKVDLSVYERQHLAKRLHLSKARKAIRRRRRNISA